MCKQHKQAVPLCLDPKGWARHRQIVWGLSLHKRLPGRTDCTKGPDAPQNTAHSVHGALTTNTSTRCPSHALQHKPHCLTRQLLFLLCLIPKERRLSWLAGPMVPQNTLENHLPPSHSTHTSHTHLLTLSCVLTCVHTQMYTHLCTHVHFFT